MTSVPSYRVGGMGFSLRLTALNKQLRPSNIHLLYWEQGLQKKKKKKAQAHDKMEHACVCVLSVCVCLAYMGVASCLYETACFFKLPVTADAWGNRQITTSSRETQIFWKKGEKRCSSGCHDVLLLCGFSQMWGAVPGWILHLTTALCKR